MRVILSPGLSSLTGPVANLRFVRGRTGPYLRQPKTVTPPPSADQHFQRTIWTYACNMWSQAPAGILECYRTLNPASDLTMFNLFTQLNVPELRLGTDHSFITANTPHKPLLAYSIEYLPGPGALTYDALQGDADYTHRVWIFGWQVQYPTKPYLRLSHFDADTYPANRRYFDFDGIPSTDVPDFATMLCHPPGVDVFSQACPHA